MEPLSTEKTPMLEEGVKQLPFPYSGQQKYMKCWRNLKTLCELRNKLRRKKKIISIEEISYNEAVDKLCNNLTSSLAVLLQMQLKNCNGVYPTRKWTKNDKVKALNLYKRSPPTYRLLRRLFRLPSQKFLNSFVNKLKFDCGTNPKIFTALKKSLTNTLIRQLNTECCLVFGSMPLKKNLSYNKKKDLIDGFVDYGSLGRQSHVASSALVFMIVAINEDYSEPIAYYLCEESLTTEFFGRIIKQVLRQCFKAELKLCAVICSFTKKNIEVIKHLGATTDRPYFSFCRREIATIFDPFDLVIRFRNLFMKYDIKIESKTHPYMIKGVAKWEQLKLFFEIDRKSKYSLAYHLTEAHLYPNKRQKKKSKLATELICSDRVHSGMSLQHMAGTLSKEAKATTVLIYRMYYLFDALTAGSLVKRNKKMYYIITENEKPQYIHELIEFLNNIEFIGHQKKPLLLQGWKHTLIAIKMLWWILIKRANILCILYKEVHLSTEKLNGKSLRKCFDCVRRNCGHKMKPTTREFISGLKTAILTKMSCHYLSDYEENDCICGWLKCFSDENIIFQNNTNENNLLTTLQHIVKCIDHTTKRDFDKTDITVFICELFLKTVVKDCSGCKKILIDNETEISSCPLNPSNSHVNKEFLECVGECVTKTDNFLNDNGHRKKLSKLVNVFIKEAVNFELLNSCATHYDENVNTIIYIVFYLCVKNYCELKNKSFHKEFHVPPTLKHDHPNM